jgi:ketosteroid isomerase-like protein
MPPALLSVLQKCFTFPYAWLSLLPIDLKGMGVSLATKDEMQALLQTYLEAYRKKDAAGCAACYASNAVVYSSYASPVQGRAAIEDLHRDWVSEGGGDKTLDILRAGTDRDSSWCVARFSEPDPPSEGFSLNVFERDKNGTWLITVSSLSEYEG